MEKLSNTALLVHLFLWVRVNGSNFRFFDSFGANVNQQRTVTADVTDDAESSTDDSGYSNSPTTSRFNGTSAAAPMVTGTVALMLEANPNLDWRNVQHILTKTSVKNGLTDSDGDGELDAIDPNAGGNAADLEAAGTIEIEIHIFQVTIQHLELMMVITLDGLEWCRPLGQ